MGPRAITTERMFEETNVPKLSLSLELFFVVTISSRRTGGTAAGKEMKTNLGVMTSARITPENI
jgi:hypothetical protein